MQFKHPELLYALVLLIIPIIVHLFQLRTFKKVPFTNVAFLKDITIQTRKSSQLKKWLTLLVRLLLFVAIIFAFAQPYSAASNRVDKTVETVIYLDNSFSMQAKGKNGPLLKRAIQDIINHVPENAPISLLTNAKTYKNTTIAALKKDLLNLEYSANQMPYETVLLKSKALFSKGDHTLKNIIYISDFQNNSSNYNLEPDTTLQLYTVKLNPVHTTNTAIDSVYLSNVSPTKLELTALLKHSGTNTTIPVSLFNANTLIAKTSVTIAETAKVTFDLPAQKIINGKLEINDSNLQFDNTLYFNINAPQNINVLAIGSADDTFLKRLYTNDEFVFTSSSITALNYNAINTQNLIILNELTRLPQALITVLRTYTSNGGTLLIIPAKDVSIDNYNRLLTHYKLEFSSYLKTPKRVTTINYSHPLYNNGVFEKRIKNFQYPKVNSFYRLKQNTTALLAFEDGSPFLTAQANTFVFTTGLATENSNFKNSPLIVPTLYNIAKHSFKIPKLYYTIGSQNTYEIATRLQQDGVLSLVKDEDRLIPRQHLLSEKVVITTNDAPQNPGIYTVMDANTALQNVSYNYDREESALNYQRLEAQTNSVLSSSVGDAFAALKSDSKINALWKWFVIFAVMLFIIEMLILKFFK